MIALLLVISPQALIRAVYAENASTVSSPSVRSESPAERYDRAQKYTIRLEQDPELGKSRENWLNALRNFRRIYLGEKESAYGSPSLFMMARISQQMHARFQIPLDLENSIEFFLELADHYPTSSLADDALYAAAESLRRHKPEDPRSLELYQRIVDVYPDGDFYVRALERINQEKLRHNPRGGRPVTPVLAKDPGYHLSRILPVKYWSSKDYTRVVIQASAPVHFDSRLLEKDGNRPRRLYLDFTPSIIQPAIREPILIQDGLLKQIRTAQFDNSTVRVVLDLESLSDYKIFSLNDPFRVVVDVHGVRSSREELRATQEQREILERLAALQNVSPELQDEQKLAAVLEAEQILRTQRLASPEKERPTTEERTIRIAQETRKEQENQGIQEDQDTQDTSGLARQDPLKARIAIMRLQDQKKVRPSNAVERSSRRSETPISSISLAQQLGLGVRKIVIDPGHGGKDPGAMAFGLKEKDVVLNVSEKLAETLRKNNFEVELTRNKDMHIPLEERTAIANTRNADLFISMHINAHPDKKIGGVETYFLNLATDAEAMRVAALENATSTHNISELQDILSNLMNNAKIDESSRLAHFVQTNLATGLKKQYKIRNLGVKQAPFYVLIGAEMPAILVEISFITNPEEAKLLQDETYLRTIVDQITSGIIAYVNHHHSAAVRLQ